MRMREWSTTTIRYVFKGEAAEAELLSFARRIQPYRIAHISRHYGAWPEHEHYWVLTVEFNKGVSGNWVVVTHELPTDKKERVEAVESILGL